MTTRILTGGGFAAGEATASHYHSEGMLVSLATPGGVGSSLGMRVLDP